MHVRKFEADSMDAALKEVKQELGPDAIILKTVTNKGLKGAFKKSRVEITAAISEKNYVKKAKVDSVLDDKQREGFYSNPSSYVANMIDTHSEHELDNANANETGYGNIGLNRSVKTVKDIGKKIKSSLDDFLSEERPSPPKSMIVESDSGYKELYELQKRRIDELEKRLQQLRKEVNDFDKKGPQGVYQLRTTLKSFDISDKYIAKVCKKVLFELSERELENPDAVFEFALKQMLQVVKTDLPLFSSGNSEGAPVVTVLFGGGGSGQSSTVHKLTALKEGSVLVRCFHSEKEENFVENALGMNVVYVKNVAEVITQTRKAIEKGADVFIDYKNFVKEADETKKFIDGLRRSFEKVDALINISAIHSEIFNRKIVNQYRSLADGLVVSGLDMCLNFGSLFNIAEEAFDLPFKFFGTGEVIPDDLEAATAERILAGIFQLK